MPLYDSPLPNPKMNELAKRLEMTRKLYDGIGLSANQCGIPERVFVIGYEDFNIVCINPKVVDESDETDKSREGCLSYPGLFVPVKRSSTIDVEFTDVNGQVQKMTLSGITARCFMHELDHMNGVLLEDHVGPLAMRMARQRQTKLIKTLKRNVKKQKRLNEQTAN
jgi:peptide deformylase